METVELIQIQAMLNDLLRKIEALAKEQIVQPEGDASELKELPVALAKAQAEFSVAGENKNNPYFKSSYADLMSVVQASRPALTKYGLSVVQIIRDDNDGKWLKTILMHSSGEWLCSKVRIIPAKNDVQSISSTITYMKRVCYVSLVGVVVGDEDDDGEAAVATSRDTFAKGVALNTKYNPKENPLEVISADQLEQLEFELADFPDIAELVLNGLKLQSLADMPKDKFLSSIRRIGELKLAESRK